MCKVMAYYRCVGLQPERGVVLIAVLWMVMALSIIVTGLTRSVRDEARMLSVARQTIQAGALGDAAIQLVLQGMALETKPMDRLTVVQAQYQGQSVAVQIMPLNGLIDINEAKAPLLMRLLTVAGGVSEAAAESMAQAIIEYRQQRTPQGASRRFEATEDLMRVPGVDYDLYARLRALITTDIRGSGLVNPMAAPLDVLAVIAGGNLQMAGQIASQRDAGQVGVDMTGLESGLVGSGAERRFRLQARVPLPDGGAVLVARYIDLTPRSQDGLPWSTFYTQRDVEPAPLRPIP